MHDFSSPETYLIQMRFNFTTEKLYTQCKKSKKNSSTYLFDCDVENNKENIK